MAFTLFTVPALVPPAHGFEEPTFLFQFGRRAVMTTETFNFPSGIGVDSVSGDVYVTDGSVHRFDADGGFIAAWSCGRCWGIDANTQTHDVYAARWDDADVVQYTADGDFVRSWGGSGSGDGQFASPFDVSVDSSTGNVYVIDGTRVQVFDAVGNFLRKWGSVGSGPGQFSGEIGRPYGIAFDPTNRRVWVSDARNDTIQAFDEFGTYLGGWDDGGGGQEPGQMRWVRGVDAHGDVYEADSDNERIQVFDADGNFLSLFQGPHNVDDGPFHPRAIAINHDTGEKYVAAAYAQRVDKFDANNGLILSWGDRESDGDVLFNPEGVTVSQLNGDVFVMDTRNFLVKRFSRAGAFLNQWGGSTLVDRLAEGLFGARETAIATDRSGYPWVARRGIHYPGDPFGYFARRFAPNGDFLVGWKRQDLDPNHWYSEKNTGIAIDPNTEFVYIADAQPSRNQIWVRDAEGAVIDTIPDVPAPAGIAIDENALYVVASQTDTIRKYDLVGNLLLEWGGNGIGDGQFDFGDVSGLAVDSMGNIYVADRNNHRIQAFDPGGVFLGKFGSWGSEPGQFRFPADVAVYKGTETLYVVESDNHRVQAFALETSPVCADGIDNDGDGYTDYPDDIGCRSPSWTTENPECDDGVDNADDDDPSLADWDGAGLGDPDPQCQAPWDRSESQPYYGCGLGAEPALILSPLVWLWRRRRARSASHSQGI